jgi:arylsulfatase A-like enzyme
VLLVGMIARICWAGVGLLLPCGAVAAADAGGGRPNVVLIIADDLRDYVGWMGGHAQSVTPNMDALAARGVRFTNAHCSYALCNPSRTALLTGLLPSSSGVFGNDQDWRRSVAVQGKPSLPACFAQQGYLTAAGGKIYHANHGGPEGRLSGWHGGRRGFEEDAAWRERFPQKGVQLPLLPVQTGRNFNGLDIWHWDWGSIPVQDAETEDGQVVAWAADFLRKGHAEPFFLAVGLYRPHSPWYVPESYFEGLPPESEIVLPAVREDDLEDVPAAALGYRGGAQSHHQRVLKAGLWRQAVRAYLASVRFCDAMLGQVLAGLEEGPNAEQTVVVFTSDHGWYLGEKERWHKGGLWEVATRVPLTIWAPQVTAAEAVCTEAVSLLDLYPTLCDLAGLEKPEHLDGQSLLPLLKRPQGKRQRPVLTLMGGPETAGYAARDRRFRYIRYSDGSEELYDHESDPHEWRNVADLAEMKAVKRRLAKVFPKSWVSAARAPAEVVGAVNAAGTLELDLQAGDVLPAAALPALQGQGVFIETRFELDPAVDGDSALLAHGTAALGYALHLVDGKATLTVTAAGRTTTVATHRLGRGVHQVRALIDGAGVISIAVPGGSEMLAEAPFEAGFPGALAGALTVASGDGLLSPSRLPNSTPFDGELMRMQVTFLPGLNPAEAVDAAPQPGERSSKQKK